MVLCFFTGNDWRDNMIATRQGRLLNPVLIPRPGRFWRHADPALRGADERLLGDPLTGQAVARPSADWALSLMRRSLLARLIGGRFERLRGRWQADLAALDLDHRYYFYEVGFYQGRDDGLFATARDLTLSCIRQLDRMVAADGAELAVVVLPSLYQVDRQEWLLMLERLSVAEADLGGTADGAAGREREAPRHLGRLLQPAQACQLAPLSVNPHRRLAKHTAETAAAKAAAPDKMLKVQAERLAKDAQKAIKEEITSGSLKAVNESWDGLMKRVTKLLPSAEAETRPAILRTL